MVLAADGTPTVELTPAENKLKTLLLDVAKFIEDSAEEDKRGNATKTVLRFTGGWVRDKLLGVESHDIDVAINNMTGYEFGTRLKQYLDVPENLEKYKKDNDKGVSLHKIEANPEKSKHLETVTTKIFGFDVDLVNLRKESYTDDSRTPQMEFGTAEEDALRRDATINALFYNLNESKVEDLTRSGLHDMRDEIIRTPMEPYQTFKDDPLRVLRLIRFASRLGFRIDQETESAMQHSDIGTALKLKISRERVGVEVEKMLRGPDPRYALQVIDRLSLYPIIFANYQDDATADARSWSRSYDALHRFLTEEDSGPLDHMRSVLVRDSVEQYYSWVIAAFAPWSTIPTREQRGKPLPPRMAEAARDSLRADNKTVAVLKEAANNWQRIIDVKNAIVEGRMAGTAAEIRQQLGLHMRAWTGHWRLCVLLSFLQEVRQGGEFVQVVQSYDKFLSYIEEQGLLDVCELKPIANGAEVMEAMGGKKGPWLSQALRLVIEWQLLHPDIDDKNEALEYIKSKREELSLRKAAREAWEQPTTATIPDSVLAEITIPASVDQLWQEISTYKASNHDQVIQNLLIAEASLRRLDRSLAEADRDAVNSLYKWASGHAFPSAVFSESSQDSSSEAQDKSRRRSTLAVSVISLLNGLLPLEKSEVSRDVIITLASFTDETDPWNAHEAFTTCNTLLNDFAERSEPSSFWITVEFILKSRIRPVFAKTKNPAITESGRKNFSPVPLPRFDTSVLDPETKPWKMDEAYITTVFSWIINQYKATDSQHLETHFPLLVPSLLALIDDESIQYKRKGCILLSQLLIPIQESKSDILRRTNLSSVFEDAIRPSFHSLPTITAEDDSIQLFTAAYPALRSLLQTSYLLRSTPTNPKFQKDTETYISKTTKSLRDHLIPSFHHISSTNSASGSRFASFPHPRLSALLLDQVAITCADLGIHTTKYLQDTIPAIHSTLSNPFGPAHPPLLLAALSATRAVILNAYPRIWRWRGEILSAVCYCWLHVTEDEEDSKASEEQKDKFAQLEKVKNELQGAVHLLRYVLENPVEVQPDSVPDAGQLKAKEDIGSEIQSLVSADESLRDCLLAEVDSEDGKYFGLTSE
ncbi:hypothetical protein BDV18DRAFT_151568 [Aspergillus unguis]